MSRSYSPSRPSRRFPPANPLEYLEQLPIVHIGSLVLVLHRRNTSILAKAADRQEEASENERRAELDLLAKMSRALVTAHILEGSSDGYIHRVQEESEAAEIKYCLALRRWKESRDMVGEVRARMYALGEREMEDAYYARVLSIEREFGILYRESDDVTGPGPSLDQSDDEDWPSGSEGSAGHEQRCSEDESEDDDDGAGAQPIATTHSTVRRREALIAL